MDESFLIKHAPRFTQKNIPAHTTLFLQDEAHNFVYFIKEGLLRIYLLNEQGQEITLSLRGKGETVGLYSFLLDSPPKSSATSIEPSSLIVWEKTDFQTALDQSPLFSAKLLQYLAIQIRQENKYLTRLATADLEFKTWKTLKRLAKLSGKARIDISQDSLASIIGATRPRVTEILHKLQDTGKLKIDRGTITLFYDIV